MIILVFSKNVAFRFFGAKRVEPVHSFSFDHTETTIAHRSGLMVQHKTQTSAGQTGYTVGFAIEAKKFRFQNPSPCLLISLLN